MTCCFLTKHTAAACTALRHSYLRIIIELSASTTAVDMPHSTTGSFHCVITMDYQNQIFQSVRQLGRCHRYLHRDSQHVSRRATSAHARQERPHSDDGRSDQPCKAEDLAAQRVASDGVARGRHCRVRGRPRSTTSNWSRRRSPSDTDVCRAPERTVNVM